MRRIILSLSLLLLLSDFSNAQIYSFGSPFIKNNNIKEYKAAGPNWAIIKDKRGVMYFANDEGVLEYDGVNWRLIKLKTLARSLAIDSAGIIYVGGDNEFGYIQPDSKGNLYYTCLSDSLDENLKDFAEINSVFATNNGIYFCSKKKIYKYSDKKISVIELTKGGFVSFYVNNILYYGDYYNGLYKIENDKPVICKGGGFYSKSDILSIIPYADNELLIATSNNKGFIYNTQTGISKNIETEDIKVLESYLKDAQMYVNGVKNIKSGYIINTLYSGVFYVDKKFRIIGHYNKSTGMQDETVISSYFENTGYIEPVWFGLYNGIARIELNTPIRKIPDNMGLSDEVNGITRFDNDLYFASISGVYKLDYDKLKNDYKFKIIDKTNQQQCWSFYKTDHKLVATSFGLYDIIKDKLVSKADNHTYKLIPYKNSVFAAKVEGLVEYTYDGNFFKYKNKINAIKTEIRDLDTDSYGNLWIKSSKNELIRLTINQNDTIVKYMTEKDGFPKTEKIYFFKYSGKLYFSTDTKLLVYNNEKKQLVEETELKEKFHNALINIMDFASDNKGSFYISKNVNNFNEIIKIKKQKNGNFNIDSTTFKRLPQMKTKSLFPDKNGLVWISTSEGLYVYDPKSDILSQHSFKTLIRKVINNDSVIFGGTYFENGKVSITQPDSFIPYFDYKNNSVSFHYSSTYYIEEKETEYYTYLEGYDKSWSKPTKITFKDYTNLYEGDYIFKVKAKNIYGTEGEVAEYAFTIYPPWYRTLWAYIAYIVLFVVFVWLLVKFNIRRLQKDKEHLEGIVRERTAEITHQKEEIEEKNHHITSSIEYASRIQQALLPPEELITEYLPDHFILYKPRDIVSGDFYWLKQIDNYTVYAAADCTGHGVPGAFMSMLGISFLNEIVSKSQVNKPSEILNELRKKIKSSLRQTGKDNESKDGMDIAVCVIDNKRMILNYAGAYNPLFIIRKGELKEIKATRNPIGIYLREVPFENHELELEKGDVLYTFSDGFVDQFGGEKQSKFKAQNFKKILLEIYDKSMKEQKTILDKTILQWQGDAEQTDDIVIFGVRI
ncbi:MAG: SpoIIE family protein phosphatase [Chlorobi bacterium]|nr:SpoIIE family protein phosphatase [Chlorobiota bacterium]